MITIKTISTFRTHLQDLLNVRKGVYSGVQDEIKREFQDADIGTIRNNRDMILMQDDAVIVKYRLGDRRMKLSKANGYRLIYMVSTIYERVVFLDIYPKRGPLQQLDITSSHLLQLIVEFNNEDEQGALVLYDAL